MTRTQLFLFISFFSLSMLNGMDDESGGAGADSEDTSRTIFRNRFNEVMRIMFPVVLPQDIASKLLQAIEIEDQPSIAHERLSKSLANRFGWVECKQGGTIERRYPFVEAFPATITYNTDGGASCEVRTFKRGQIVKFVQCNDYGAIERPQIYSYQPALGQSENGHWRNWHKNKYRVYLGQKRFIDVAPLDAVAGWIKGGCPSMEIRPKKLDGSEGDPITAPSQLLADLVGKLCNQLEKKEQIGLSRQELCVYACMPLEVQEALRPALKFKFPNCAQPLIASARKADDSGAASAAAAAAQDSD